MTGVPITGHSYPLRTERFVDWLESTRALQREFGGDPGDLEGNALADYIVWNHTAAIVELSELLQELPWKPWKTDRGRPDSRARALAVEEIADVLHFLGNIAVALRVTDEELSTVYARKQLENRRRLGSGAAVQTNTGEDTRGLP